MSCDNNWANLTFYILERIFSYLDSYELFIIVPQVCYGWKNSLKQCLLPKELLFFHTSDTKHGGKVPREQLTDEILHRLFIDFDLSKTTYLLLYNQMNLKDRSILNVANYCKNLSAVNLKGCCSLNDVSLKYLSSVETLQTISISLAEITGSSLHFLARLSKLEGIFLEKLFRLRSDFLETFLSSYPALKRLSIRQCKLITHSFFLFLIADVELPVLEELFLDGLLENKGSVRFLPDLNFEQQSLRFLSLRRLSLYNLIWLHDLQLMGFLRVCSMNRFSEFEVVRCNPLLLWSVNSLLAAPNITFFVIEGNQALSDRDLLDSMFSHRSGLFRNCSNISDQMKRQMARTNPAIKFEQSAALFTTVQ